MAERLDGAHYRDDILRLLFICCHPDLPATQQIALALRIVSGLSVKQIARAFLVGEAAMEQRITRAKGRIANGRGALRDAGPRSSASERLAAVAAMVYLRLQRGLFGGAAEAERPRAALRRGDPAGAAAAAAVPDRAGDHGADRADAPAARAGGGALRRRGRRRPAGRPGPQPSGTRRQIAEGLALIDKAMRHRRPGPYQVQAAIAALHARASTPRRHRLDGDRAALRPLERLQPSPGGDAQPRRGRLQGPRAGGGARHDRAAGAGSCRAISTFAARAAAC